ncbi:iron-containing redox enzyme family protein [Massilia norwichensis]|uniref:Iron-containing redox enzyme family protein n=1 Tax=Massilia norwichensis TaxID=1442366 RepID=A0ABT2A606_9BURK|nr:iron-containing redox enzyme family protein [Massilia norwichensis]MCS0589621.1 iron-containing redox enzyme family protein [Massilia norwichensis]
MTTTYAMDTPELETAPQAHARQAIASSKALYFSLLDNPQAALAESREFLLAQIEAARQEPCELPEALWQLPAWIQGRAEAVGISYREYLSARKNGAPRRYFSNKSHALYFLKGAAPTKLVDGAWLYGTLPRWENPDFHPLIKTYLEELGDGVPDKNHVTLYRRLLAAHGCEHWESLSEPHFVQGAIQLALAYNADQFLPEVIGYNLGYEQLPLHLLITSYELNELGIDPYYFTLHVTVDNAGSGHAHKAVQALRNLMAQSSDLAAFFQRVLDGYRLNELGACTTSIIAAFDLEAELVEIFTNKAAVGRNMHSDYCRVAGRSINDWLGEPAKIPEFMAAMESAGWIKRGEEAENSRFWRLIQGERAEMFGVFSSYEQQVLRDWIQTPREVGASQRTTRVLSHRARQRTLETLNQHAGRGSHPERSLIRRHAAGSMQGDSELRELEEKVAGAAGKSEAMAMLGKLMSPSLHHTAIGLMATRLYSQLLDA